MFTTTVCAVLTAGGVALAFVTAYRRHFVAATRIAALSLLPLGLAMAGLLTLGGEVGRAVAEWAADLVLDPTTWAGFGVLGCAALLLTIARVARRRVALSDGRAELREPRRAMPSGSRRADDSPLRGAPQHGRGGQVGQGGADDFSEVEAILKKHGI